MPLRNRLLALLTLLAVLAATAAACGDDGTSGPTTTGPGATSTSVADPSSTTTEVPATTRPPGPGGASIPAEYAALVDAAEQVRGLRFLADPLITPLSAADLAARLQAELEEEIDPADVAIEEAFFELLGILPAGVDLAQAWIDLYTEQFVAWYDGETGELVVPGDGEPTPLQETIIVHELIHALADQHFGLSSTLDALIEEERYHEAAALQALAEGEATYFQIVYLQSMPIEDQVRAAAEALDYDTTVADSLPEWFSEDLAFPYDQGFRFVETLIEINGIAAVDQAYRRLPTTVEQIMHPEAYRRFEPGRPVDLPGNAILPGYEIYQEGEFGEWNLRLYLLDGVSDGDAVVASAGWGGDDHRILWNGTEVAFLYRFEGDTPRDARELAEALVESVGARMAVGSASQQGGATVFRGDDFAWVLLDGSTVSFVAATDPAGGETLAGVLTPSEG